MSDFNKRLITAIFGLIALILVIYSGGIPLKIGVSLISLLASIEFYNAFKKINIKVHLPIVVFCIISLIFFNHFSMPTEISVVLVVILSMVYLLFTNKTNLVDVMCTVFTFVYIPYSIFLMLNLSDLSYLCLIFIIAFSTDTFAYLVGSTLGKHKLIEKVSPNKSVEGAIGGILGCLIISLVYFYYTNIPINIGSLIFLVCASIVSQIGDLSASKIKRETGIKDFSKILPGHGGIMDRFDSIIMVIPMVYLLYYINNIF